MSTGFLQSFALFGPTYAVGVSVATSLAIVGVWVIGRNQIFLGAAVAQASTLGIATALAAGSLLGTEGWHGLESEVGTRSLAVFASVLTALGATRLAEREGESPEAVIGWIFLLATALPVLLVAHLPHALEEVHRLVFSSLLSVRAADPPLFTALLAASALLAALLHRPLLLLVVDPDVARATGVPTRRLELAFALWLGLAAGLSMRAAGMLYTFGALVLAPLVARCLCREVRPMLLVAPAVAALASLGGFFAGHLADWPPAHATVALLAALLPPAWAVRRLRARRFVHSP